MLEIWLVVGSIVGVIGGFITQSKNRGFLPGFALGFLPCFIGLIIAVVLAPLPAAAAAPSGMRAVRCPRCNADQNVPVNVVSAECWQCHLDIPLTTWAPSVGAAATNSPYAAVPVAPPSLKDAPTLAAAQQLFPQGQLPALLKVEVLKAGDPNFGKFGTVDQYRDGLAYVRFSALGPQTPYELDALRPKG
jgi:hypothetical protein